MLEKIKLKKYNIQANAVKIMLDKNKDVQEIVSTVAVDIKNSFFLSLSVNDLGIIIYNQNNCGFCINWNDYNRVKTDNEEEFLDEIIEYFKKKVLNECK